MEKLTEQKTDQSKTYWNSYPLSVKQKVVSEIKPGAFSNRSAAKRYLISRNTINSWVIEDSLLTFKLSNLSEEVMAKPVGQGTVVKKLNKQVVELQKALKKANLKIVDIPLQTAPLF
ncbi:hypothetical protein ACYSNM_13320 [Myroides sp. LJL116]